MSTYYKMVRAEARIPEDNDWDRGRTASDSTVHPNYHEEIQFASLSLDGRGIIGFGEYFITFKENNIAHRASVFEENPFQFCDRHRIAAGAGVPPGYRASWAERQLLATSKLYSKISASTQSKDYAGILGSRDATTRPDFIEVHIYGTLHISAIECVIGPKPPPKERPLWRQVQKTLSSLGATVVET